MFDSPYIKKLYQFVCNSIGNYKNDTESIDKMDKHEIDIYLRCTLDRMDKMDIQYPFLKKLNAIGVINKPHRANVKWNAPFPIPCN